MKLIEPSVELIKQEPGIEGIYKQIERCARVCYKSEDKITEDSAKKFVDMLINNRHGAMLEHGTVYLSIPNSARDFEAVVDYSIDKYTKGVSLFHNNETVNYITTNYRVLVENDWLDDLQYICEPTKYHEKRYTLKFTTSIGITRELIRHRHFSFANESTRYCNYSKKGIEFIIPQWYKGDNAENDKECSMQSELEVTCEQAEASYNRFIEWGAKPQQAREVLPLCTKSEIIMTGFESDWNAFFKLRCDKAAHPDMQIIANKAKEIIDNEKV